MAHTGYGPPRQNPIGILWILLLVNGVLYFYKPLLCPDILYYPSVRLHCAAVYVFADVLWTPAIFPSPLYPGIRPLYAYPVG